MGPSAGSYRPPRTACFRLSKMMGLTICLQLILRIYRGAATDWQAAVRLHEAACIHTCAQSPGGPSLKPCSLLRSPAAPHLLVVKEAKAHGGHLGRRRLLAVQRRLHGAPAGCRLLASKHGRGPAGQGSSSKRSAGRRLAAAAAAARGAGSRAGPGLRLVIPMPGVHGGLLQEPGGQQAPPCFSGAHLLTAYGRRLAGQRSLPLVRAE